MLETVTEPITNGHNPPAKPGTEAAKAESLTIRRGIRSILRQAVSLKDLAYDTAMRMRESLDDDDSADRARAQSQAVTSLIKGWSETVEAIRIARNKPLPGSRRPLPEQPKGKKSKPANRPPSFRQPVQPAPSPVQAEASPVLPPAKPEP